VNDPLVVEQEIVLEASPEELWAALTDPAELPGWFGASVDWDLTPGGRARFTEEDGSQRAGVVEIVRPGSELQFRWWPVGTQEGAAEPATEVHYTLEEVDEGTRLTVTERSTTAGTNAAVGAQASLRSPQASAGWGIRLAGLWLACRVPTCV
jgi:uncharacterized protein YndB with AHSA1/START domain